MKRWSKIEGRVEAEVCCGVGLKLVEHGLTASQAVVTGSDVAAGVFLSGKAFEEALRRVGN